MATPTARRREQPEAAIQRAIVDGLLLLLGPRYLVLHVPNGGARSPKEAAILKGMGVRAGAADILISGNRFSGWLEVKADDRKPSPAQVEFSTDCAARSIPYAVVRSVDEALAAVVAWGLATRSHDGAVRLVRAGEVERVARAAGATGRGDAGESPAVREVPERRRTARRLKSCTCETRGMPCRGTATLGELWRCAVTGETLESFPTAYHHRPAAASSAGAPRQAHRTARLFDGGRGPDSRRTDRALQLLRRAGLISYDRAARAWRAIR